MLSCPLFSHAGIGSLPHCNYVQPPAFCNPQHGGGAIAAADEAGTDIQASAHRQTEFALVFCQCIRCILSLLVVSSFCDEVRADSPPALSSPQTGGYWDEDWGHAVQQGQEAPANGGSATTVLTAAARAADGAACAAATAHMLPRSWLDNEAVFQPQQCGESSQLEAGILLPPMSRLRRRRHRHREFQANANGMFDNRTAELSPLQTRKDIASSSETDG